MLAALLTLSSFGLARAQAELAGPEGRGQTSARVIVTYKAHARLVLEHPWRPGDTPAAVRQVYRDRAAALAARHGLDLDSVRAVGPQGHALSARGISALALARRLAEDPDVASVEIDHRRRALNLPPPPNDPLYAAGSPANPSTRTGGPEAGQWHLRAPTATFRSAADVEGAWATTRGDPAIVVAVLDTGVLADHEDLDPQRSGRVLPGYDLIADVATANDGDGRDADASDPGDWITRREDLFGEFAGCGESDSTWHGTHVAGIVGAMTDNGVGMAGVAPLARILPVRVLGKCGGWDSDIAAGMRWAAGLAEPGMPANPHPARVLNLSLGGGGACTSVYEQAVSAISAAGAVIVAAAGNSTGREVGAPANCAGVIAVTGLRHAGTKVGFADLGPEIAIAAPAGNCVNVDVAQPCLYPIVATTNRGTRAPDPAGSTYTDAFNYSVGTSFAAPLVAGTAALMLSVRPELLPSQVRSILQAAARPFPTEGADNGDDPTPVPVCQPPSATDQLQCYCVTGLCGVGMLDAGAAMAQTLAAYEAPGEATGSGATSAPWLAALAFAAWRLRRGGRRWLQGKRGHA